MNDQEKDGRARVLLAAKSWLMTPYHDCSCLKGVGVDCAFLIKAIFEEAGIEPPVAVEPYSPQWYLHRNEELYLNHVAARAVEIKEAEAIPGDLVLYKFGRCYAHGALIVDPGWPRIIHAYKQAQRVTYGEGNQGYLAERPRKFFTHKTWAQSRS